MYIIGENIHIISENVKEAQSAQCQFFSRVGCAAS
jgi:hypothetical protein